MLRRLPVEQLTVGVLFDVAAQHGAHGQVANEVRDAARAGGVGLAVVDQ